MENEKKIKDKNEMIYLWFKHFFDVIIIQN